MASTAGLNCVKYLLFLFNFIFWLSGIGILVAGAVIQIRYTKYFDFLGSTFFSAPILLIVVGCVIAIIGFFGCCGAIRENYCMTMTFAVLLGIIFLLEIAAGIASYVLKNDVERILKTSAEAGMVNYGHPDAKGTKLAWDGLQEDFKCCGVASYSSWNISKYLNEQAAVPDSCCKVITENCGRGKLSVPDNIYTKGCLEELKNWIVKNAAILGGVGVGIAFVQVIGVMLACCYASALKKGYDSV